MVTKDCREPIASVHDEFLTVSWTGDREYKLALAFGKAWKQHLRSRAEAEKTGQFLREKDIDSRERIGTECRKRIRKGGPASYAYECYVFFKSNDLVPLTLAQMHPALVPLFRRAPLHHYFLVERYEVAADHGNGKVFTEWKGDKTFATKGHLIDDLKSRLCPAPCPGKDDGEGGGPWHIPWKAIAIVLLSASVLVLAAFVLLQYLDHRGGTGGMDRVETVVGAADRVPEPDVRNATALPGSEFEALRAGQDALAAQLDALVTQPGQAAVLERITVLAGTVAVLTERVGGEMQTGGLDLPPCLPVREAGGQRIPAYLFMAYVGESGITPVAIAHGTGEDGRAAAAASLPYIVAAPTAPLSAADFAAQSRGLFEASEAAGCRHYVMLVEDDPRSAPAYIANRQAVEDYFYIYRLRR